MRKYAIILFALLLSVCGFSQKQTKFIEEDVKQFYHTLQGDYDIAIDDSTWAIIHITPIWENIPYHWFYVEALQGSEVLVQKVIEVTPKTNKVFKVTIHDLKQPEQFAGKWANRNYFDGFTKNIIKGGSNLSFFKTSDFSYQSNWVRLGTLECFPKGDLLHFKFVQQDERLYIKRMPANTTRLLGYQGLKQPID